MALCLSVNTGDPLSFADTVAVADPIIRLRDVADLSVLPPALLGRAGGLEVADLGMATAATLSGRLIAERARRQLPGLTPWLDEASDQQIHIRLAPSASEPAGTERATQACARLTRIIETGEIVSASDLTPAACEENSRSSFTYDRATGGVRAARSLAAGETVSRPPAFAVSAIAPGQVVTLQAKIGPVVVERDVVALQAAWEGQNFFVRAADGQVFTATAPARANQEAAR